MNIKLSGKIPHSITLFILLILSLWVFSSCNYPPPHISSSRTNRNAGAPRIEITFPDDGATLRVGVMIDVHSRFTSPDEVTGATLLVNDQPHREDVFVKTVPSGALLQPWTPQEPGTYQLRVVLKTSGQVQKESSPITVQVITYTFPPQEGEITLNPTLTPGTPTITLTVSPTLSPTSNRAQATGTQNANCRRGPDTVYEVLGILMDGTTVPIIGRNQSSTWFVVQLDKPAVDCWVWGGGVTTSGDLSDLNVISPPPKPVITNTLEGPVYETCEDYPDESTCFADPAGIGGCSWDTGLGICSP